MKPEIIYAAIGEVIRAEIDRLPKPERGEKGAPGDAGRDGADGRDGASVGVEEVAAAILAIPAFEVLVKGDPGDPGRDGTDGEPGADGLGLELPLHEAGAVYRAGALVSYAHGKVYKALVDTASKPGSADWQRVGALGFEFKGVKTEEAYEEGDIYVDGGSAFIVTRGRGRLLAGRGKDGAKGDRGEPGESAPRVVAVKASADSLVFAFDNGAVEEASLEGLGLWSDAVLAEKVAALTTEARLDARDELKSLVLRCADFAALQREIATW